MVEHSRRMGESQFLLRQIEGSTRTWKLAGTLVHGRVQIQTGRSVHKQSDGRLVGHEFYEKGLLEGSARRHVPLPEWTRRRFLEESEASHGECNSAGTDSIRSRGTTAKGCYRC